MWKSINPDPAQRSSSPSMNAVSFFSFFLVNKKTSRLFAFFLISLLKIANHPTFFKCNQAIHHWNGVPGPLLTCCALPFLGYSVPVRGSTWNTHLTLPRASLLCVYIIKAACALGCEPWLIVCTKKPLICNNMRLVVSTLACYLST